VFYRKEFRNFLKGCILNKEVNKTNCSIYNKTLIKNENNYYKYSIKKVSKTLPLEDILGNIFI